MYSGGGALISLTIFRRWGSSRFSFYAPAALSLRYIPSFEFAQARGILVNNKSLRERGRKLNIRLLCFLPYSTGELIAVIHPAERLLINPLIRNQVIILARQITERVGS